VIIRNLREVNDALAPYIAKTSRLFDDDLKLERVHALLKPLGNPHEKLRIVHLAGTSGKTSTSYYTAELLRAAGKKVGLTVSPHVDSINERVQIDGKPLPEAVFCKELGDYLDIVEDIAKSQSPSYFELLAAFAFWIFARHEVDYVVLETGLGGMYDASNVARRSDKVCIITDIGFDHMHVLGNTLSEIAAQKAGIIHDHNQVFMYKQSVDIMRSIRKRVKEQQAHLHLLDEHAERRIWQADLSDMAEYQQRNWLLAFATYRHLEKRDGLKHLTRQVLLKAQAIQVPGRMDIKEVDGKTLIMDGAHNNQKITTFINSFHRLYPGEKPAVLLSLRDTKDYHDLIPLLIPFAGRIIATAFETSQDSLVRSMDPEELGKAIREAGFEQVTVIPNLREAYDTLLASPEKICLITGSFYLLNQIRNNVLR